MNSLDHKYLVETPKDFSRTQYRIWEAKPSLKVENLSVLARENLLVASWLNTKSKSTQEWYFREVIAFFSKNVNTLIKDTDISHVSTYLTYIYKEFGVSKHQKVKSALSSLFSFANKAGYTDFNPVKAIRSIKPEPSFQKKILQEDEIKKIIENTGSPRDKAFISLLALTGIRVAGAKRLKFQDLEEGRKIKGGLIIKVTEKGDKTRAIKVPENLLDALYSLKQPQTKKEADARDDSSASDLFVFRSQKSPFSCLSNSQCFEIVRKAAKKAKIRRDISPHWFRHSYATRLINNEVPLHRVQILLGHASIEITSRYLHTSVNEFSGDLLDEL